jgi:CDP-glucose 4,6-dehydratase
LPTPSDAAKPAESGGVSWSGRSVFVTGAAGFVGSWLTEALCRRGARVTALVWPGDDDARWRPLLDFEGVTAVRGCVEDPVSMADLIQAANADTVFHLAAINVNIGTAVSPLAIFETNVRGTWNVLEACRVTPTIERVVVASSREAEDGSDADPAAAPRCRNRHPYQASKMSAELVAQAYSDTYDMPIVISRSDNVYGGRDLNWNRLIPGAVRSLLGGEAPVLRSDGTLKRDYVYVDDMVRAYLLLAARAGDPGVRGEMFHFATGVSTSTLEIVRELAELTGRADLRPVTASGSVGERVNQERSTTRERDVLGWTSQVRIKEGLHSTVNWYREHLEARVVAGNSLRRP